MLKTGWVMYSDVLAKGESRRLPSMLEGELTDSAICNQQRNAISKQIADSPSDLDSTLIYLVH